jgi:hypothetical protein
MVRAPGLEGLWTLYRPIVACAEGAARDGRPARRDAGRGRVRADEQQPDAARAVRRKPMRELEMPAGDPMPDRVASSDIGNVSGVVPTSHRRVATAAAGTAIHTRDFREAAAGPLARAGLIGGAEALAVTALDLLPGAGRVARAEPGDR